MAHLPESITLLISALGKLPGIGPRSAERLALFLVQSDVPAVEGLARALLEARRRIQFCGVCGSLTEAQPCEFCSDARRDSALICVVERAVDVISLSKSGTYRGRFHVLGGKISPLNGVGPEDLRIAGLAERAIQEGVREVIIALPSDVEGDATSYYLAKLLHEKVKVTRIAQGLPVGSGLEFADELTLTRALEGRRELPS